MPWTVNGTETDGLEGSEPNVAPGETVDYPFLFAPRHTAGDDHIERFRTVRDVTLAMGLYDTYETLDGIWYWREQGSKSPLVHIEPPSDDPTARRVWGLIEGFDDNTTLADKRCTLTLSIQPISIGNEFTTETQIRQDREVIGP